MLNCISDVLKDSGSIIFMAKDISGISEDSIEHIMGRFVWFSLC